MKTLLMERFSVLNIRKVSIRAGSNNIEKMKELADSGNGLNSDFGVSKTPIN